MLTRVLHALLVVLTLAALAFSVVRLERFLSNSLLSDFKAFYCASQIMVAGKDPYLQQPLYGCEAKSSAAALWRATGNVTDPVPLPPYAIAAFLLLGKLPFGVSSLVWTLVLFCVWIAAAEAVRAITGLRWTVIGTALFFAAAMSVSLGQIAPIAIAALCVAGLLLVRGREPGAGAIAALAMIEPHLALPSCIALFLCVPRSRWALLIAAVLFAAISLHFGIDRNVEYATRVLPAHAISDVWDVGQFSLTVFGHALGLSDGLAVKLGSICYGLMSTAGIVVTYRLSKRLGPSPLIPILPMAFAVFGGPYVHWQQVAAAIPAVLLLLRPERVPRVLLTIALVGLAIPWLYVVAWGFLIPAAVAVVGVLCWQLLKPRILAELVIVTGALAVLLMVNHRLPHESPPVAFHAATLSRDLADMSWEAYVRARIPIGHGLLFLLHFPTWIALGLVAGFAVWQVWLGQPKGSPFLEADRRTPLADSGNS